MIDNNYRDDDTDYVTHLEHQVLELRNKVRLLKSDNRGGKSSKDELWRTYQWTEANLMFSDQVITFTKEYCFLNSNSSTKSGYNLNSPTNLSRERVCQ